MTISVISIIEGIDRFAELTSHVWACLNLAVGQPEHLCRRRRNGQSRFWAGTIRDGSSDASPGSATTNTLRTACRYNCSCQHILDSILPLDLVSLSAFAEDHGIPWSAVTKAVKDYELFPERGVWKEGWRTVKVAIDERGRATFYDLFHTHAKFKRCDECPHKWW